MITTVTGDVSHAPALYSGGAQVQIRTPDTRRFVIVCRGILADAAMNYLKVGQVVTVTGISSGSANQLINPFLMVAGSGVSEKDFNREALRYTNDLLLATDHAAKIRSLEETVKEWRDRANEIALERNQAVEQRDEAREQRDEAIQELEAEKLYNSILNSTTTGGGA